MIYQVHVLISGRVQGVWFRTGTKEKAEESDRLKSAFVASISHEIKTPMNGIRGFSHLLKNPQLSAAKKDEFTTIIIKSTDRLLHMINDIVDINGIPLPLPLPTVKMIVYRVYRISTRKTRNEEILEYHLDLLTRNDMLELV